MSAKRFLIAIALPQSKGMGLGRLDYAESDTKKIADLLISAHGYARVLEDIRPDITAQTLRARLSAWFADNERKSDDEVLLYFAAHGGFAGKANEHFIFTNDSDPKQPSLTALKSQSLPEIIFDGENPRPQTVLVILDTCYAGEGAAKASAIAGLQDGDWFDSDGGGFYLISSSGPKSQAKDGAFVSAFAEAIESPLCAPRGGMEFVEPGPLVYEINRTFNARALSQRARIYIVGAGRSLAPFFRNPNYVPGFDGPVLSDEAHWSPKGRGVDALASFGAFFTGRAAARADLVSLLASRDGDRRARVVTGNPGSGKSAVLSWLVLAANARARAQLQGDGHVLDPALTPPVGAIDSAVHARGMRVNELVRILARDLDAPGADFSTLLKRIEARSDPVRIVIDALDEAAEAKAIERDVLRPLAASANVRLILGGRRFGERPPLADAAKIIDLDAPEYFAEADIAHYVTLRLAQAGREHGSDMGANELRRVGDAVAKAAQGSFLYARVVTRRLADAGVLDTSSTDWISKLALPGALGDAFAQDLERFEPDERARFLDLMRPLAYARGKGLPHKRLWPDLAARMAQLEEGHYDECDVSDLFERAGFYIVQDIEFGQAVVRLFHQEFADFIRSSDERGEMERRFATGLWRLDEEEPDRWSNRSEPYVESYLPAHAAAGGALRDWIFDPQLLLHTRPEALLPHLPALMTGESAFVAAAYRAASVKLRDEGPVGRRPYLAMALLQHGAQALAARMQALGGAAPWRADWARWSPPPSHYAFADGDARITKFELFGKDGRGGLLGLGRANGDIEVWEIDRGVLLQRWTRLGSGEVVGVGLVEEAGQALIGAAWGSGLVAVCAVGEDRPLAAMRLASRPTAFCVGEDGQAHRCAIATESQRIEVRDLRTLGLVAEKERATDATVDVLRVVESGGRRYLIAGGDTYYRGRQVERKALKVWSYPTLKLAWAQRIERGLVQEIDVGAAGGRDVLVTGEGGPLRIYDLKTKAKLFEDEELVSSARLARLDGRDLLLTAYDSALHVREIFAGAKGIELTPARTLAEVGYMNLSRVGNAVGRPALFDAAGTAVRVWDLAEFVQAQEQPSAQAELAGLVGDDDGLFLLNRGGKLFELDPATGAERWSLALEGGNKLAHGKSKGRDVIIAADDNGALHLVDRQTKKVRRNFIHAGELVQRLVAVDDGGTPVLLATVRRNREWSARVWNLDTRVEIEPSWLGPHGWGLTLGQGDKVLYGLAAVAFEGDIRFVFASRYSKVMASALHGPMTDTLYGFYEWGLPGARNEYVGSLAADAAWGVVAAGEGDGRLTLLDLHSGKVRRSSANAHRTAIASIALKTEGRRLVATGSRDGELRIWNEDLHLLLSVELGSWVDSLVWLNDNRLAVGAVRGVLMLDIDANLIVERAGEGASALDFA